jgi:hypothetical protein
MHTKYVLVHLIEFKEIINKIIESHKSFEETNKLKIQIDPWDNYLYFDSKMFLDFCFNNNTVLTEDKFIQLKFLLFVYYNDLMSNFKKEGKIISNRLNEFFK